jgi:hypothetical protein
MINCTLKGWRAFFKASIAAAAENGAIDRLNEAQKASSSM